MGFVELALSVVTGLWVSFLVVDFVYGCDLFLLLFETHPAAEVDLALIEYNRVIKGTVVHVLPLLPLLPLLSLLPLLPLLSLFLLLSTLMPILIEYSDNSGVVKMFRGDLRTADIDVGLASKKRFIFGIDRIGPRSFFIRQMHLFWLTSRHHSLRFHLGIHYRVVVVHLLVISLVLVTGQVHAGVRSVLSLFLERISFSGVVKVQTVGFGFSLD